MLTTSGEFPLSHLADRLLERGWKSRTGLLSRCYRLIGDGAFPVVRRGSRVFVDPARLPEIAGILNLERLSVE